MSNDQRPLFTSDWPRYARAAHVSFWSMSALMLAACAAGYLGLANGHLVIWSIGAWLLSGTFLGASAIVSGKLYVGNQVFSRTPTTGLLARVYGGAAAASTGFVLWFFYGLMQIRGG